MVRKKFVQTMSDSGIFGRARRASGVKLRRKPKVVVNNSAKKRKFVGNINKINSLFSNPFEKKIALLLSKTLSKESNLPKVDICCLLASHQKGFVVLPDGSKKVVTYNHFLRILGEMEKNGLIRVK